MFKVRMTTSGVHLFDRDTGTNVLLDEFDPKHLSEAPANVSISLTDKCNLNCGHCFVRRIGASLDFDQLIGWLSELDANGCLGVGVGGGEPFLYGQLQDVCRFVRQNTSMACTLTTNGTLIDASAVYWMKECLSFCRISLDGVADIHERDRGFKYEETLARVRRCTDAGIRVGVNFLVNDVTVGDLDALVRDVQPIGVKEILLIPEMSTVGRKGASTLALALMRKWICDYEGPIRIRLSSFAAGSVPEAVAVPGDSGLRSYAHINSAGVLMRSSHGMRGVKIDKNGVIQAFHKLTREVA